MRDWSKYDACGTCGVSAEKQCESLTSQRGVGRQIYGVLTVKHPHTGRRKMSGAQLARRAERRRQGR